MPRDRRERVKASLDYQRGTETILLVEDEDLLRHVVVEMLGQLGYRNVHVRAGDGYLGWAEAAPFDAVVVTCGADHVPEPLFEQLKIGGVMVIPVGEVGIDQTLRLITKGPKGERRTRDLCRQALPHLHKPKPCARSDPGRSYCA